VDGLYRPIDVRGHAQDANMVVHNNVIESVVATVTTGILEDIHTHVCKRPSIAMLPPSPIVQFLNKENTQDSLLFPLPSIANDIHVSLEPTSQVQDPLNM
jgi:hypothetical protein